MDFLAFRPCVRRYWVGASKHNTTSWISQGLSYFDARQEVRHRAEIASKDWNDTCCVGLFHYTRPAEKISKIHFMIYSTTELIIVRLYRQTLNNKPEQQWYIKDGNVTGRIQLADTTFCMDAGAQGERSNSLLNMAIINLVTNFSQPTGRTWAPSRSKHVPRLR